MVSHTNAPENLPGNNGANGLIIHHKGGDKGGITIPHDEFLFSAEFNRDGFDLIIKGQNGKTVIVENYFDSETPQDLLTPDGIALKGEIVGVLAGPDNAGAYAQDGEIAGSTPIGQVETLTGTASVQRTDGTVEQLQIGSKVFQNDVVQTSEGSTLSITFADKTIFTLSSSSRMVLSELVYAPESSENSALFNLVEGSFVFIAGQVAKTGDMKVETPVATMGIRGTTVKVDIVTDANGQANVSVSLNRDIDGTIGSVELTNKLDGSVTLITAIESNWVVSTSDGTTTEVPRTVDSQSTDQEVIESAFQAVRSVEARQAAGEQPVQLDDAGEDGPPNGQQEGEGDNEAGDQPNPNGEGEGNPEENAPGQQGNLGSGLGTSGDEGPLEQGLGDGQGDGSPQPLGQPGPNPGGGNRPPPSNNNSNDANNVGTNTTTTSTVTPPTVTLPGSAIVDENGTITLSGINISGGSGGNLNVTLTAGSTISIVAGSGVVIDTAQSIESPPGSGNYDKLVFSGTPAQVNAALNGAVYTPTANDPDGLGSLTVSVSNGGSTASKTLLVNITQVINVNEAGAVTLSLADFDTFGVNTTVGNPTFTINNTTNGEIQLLGTAVTSFTLSDLNSGNVQYVHDGSETLTASINFTVTNAGNSVTNTTKANVTAVNDNPVVAGDLAVNVDEAGSVTLTAADIDASDADNLDSSIVFTLNGVTNGQVLVGGASVAAFTLDDIANNRVQYVHDGTETTTAAINLIVEDGVGGFTNTTINVAVTPVNDAPEITTAPGVHTDYLEGDDPVVVNNTIVITDVDGGSNGPTNIATASVGFRSNYVQGEDILIFEDFGPFTHNFNPTTGLLVIFGNATPAEFQAAIRTVKYQNISENPSDLVRVMEFRATDGIAGGDSVIITSEVDPTGVNDAPTISISNFDVDGIVANDSQGAGDPDPTLVLTNNGSGTFSPFTFPIETRSSDVKLADIDSDGDLDAILGIFGGANSILVNQGGIQAGTEGTFSLTTLSSGGSDNTLGIAVGDIDRDGDLDILVANWVGSSSEVLLNQGGAQAGAEGTFVATDLPGANTGGPSGFRQGRDVALADVDGDGDLDAIIANGQSANQLYLNQGGIQAGTEGTFAASDLPFVVSTVPGINLSVKFGDLDGDGDLDAIIGKTGAVNEILLNNGAGGFSVSVLNGGAQSTTDIVLGDLDGDGDLDGIIANNAGEQNQIFINQGGTQGGTEGTFVTSTISGSFGSSSDVTLVDIDSDGDLDAVISNNTFNTANDQTNQLLVNDGLGNFTVSTLVGGNSATTATAFGDLDGDAVYYLGENIVQNGGFENSPDGPGGVQLVNTNDSTTIVGWTVNTGTVDVVSSSSAIAPAVDDRTIDLNGSTPGSITQTLNTVAGQTYVVSFTISGDPDDGEIPGSGKGNEQADVNVTIDGTSQSFGFVNPVGATRANPGFETKTFTFTASGSSSVLTFASQDLADANSGPYIDQVQVRKIGNSIVEDTPTVLAGISINDVDATDPSVTITSSNGTFDFAAGADTSNLTVNSGAGSSTLTIRGPLADLQTLVANFIEFTPALHFNGLAGITVTINDLGQSGQGTAQQASETFEIYISPVNDAPVINGAGTTLAVDEDVTGVFSGISITDVDAGNQDIEVSLSVINGDLSFTTTAATSGLTFSDSDGTDGTLTFTGSQSAINTALAELEYTSNVNYNGPDTLTINVDDQGNTGSGGSETDTETVNITVNPVNDAPVVSATGNKLLASNRGNGHGLGEDVAINASGDIVSGAAGFNAGAGLEGVGYFFNANGSGSYDASQQLNSPVESANDFFGRDVAINDNGIIAISAPGDTNSRGVIIVHTPNGVGGFNTQTLVAPAATTPADGDFLGLSVAINNNGLIVATANGDDDAQTGAGALFVFTPDGSGGYNDAVEIFAPDAAAGDNLGDGLSVNENGVIVVGANNGDGNVANSGTAYVFTPDVGTATGYDAGVELVTGNGDNGDFFGSSVAINAGGAIAVGAPGDNNGEGTDAGSIYFYSSAADTTPLNIIGNNGKFFGSSVALNDSGILVVGSPGTAFNGGNGTGDANTGAIFIYRPDGSGGFLNPIRIQAPDKAADDDFGTSVAINNDGTIVVGAQGDDGDAGSLYTFVPDGSGGYLPSGFIYHDEGDQFAADYSPRTGDIQAETFAGTQDDPKITALDNGGYVVVWEVVGQVSGEDVFLQIFDANGNKVGGEVQVATSTTANQFDPAITQVSGGFVVGWTDDDGTDAAVKFQRFDNSGTKLSPVTETIINTTLPGEQVKVDVAGLSGGGFVASWQTDQNDVNDIYARVFDATGTPVTGEFIANSVTAGSQDSSSIVALQSGNFAIVWQGAGNELIYREFDTSANPLTSEINPFAATTGGTPTVVELGNGQLLAVLEVSGGVDGDGSSIEGVIFQNTGAILVPQFTLNTTTAGNQSQPSVVALDDGGFFVVYNSPDAGSNGIFGQRYDAAANRIGAEIRLNQNENGDQDTSRNSSSQVVTQLEDGSIAVTFESTSTDVITRIFELPANTVSVETINLQDYVTFSDVDDTPSIDESSISVTNNANSDARDGAEAFFNIIGTQVSIDTGLFDFLDDGETAIFDISFNIVSGADTITRTLSFNINGISDNTINLIDDTSSPVSTSTGSDGTVNGTNGADLIAGLGAGANDFQGDKLFGLAGNDILIGGDTGSELFDGGDGDDTIITGDSNPDDGDYIIGSLGNDRFNYGRNANGSQDISYGNLTATMISIIATIDFATNTGTIQKFSNTGSPKLVGTDTLVDMNKVLETSNGGFSIRGSQQADTYNIDAGTGNFISLVGGRGNDIFNLESGIVRLEFRVEADGISAFSGATQAANVNLSLANNQIINDGFGGTDDVNFIGSFASGSGNRVEIRGTDFSDTLIGDAGDNRFIGERGNDIIDGGAGVDLIRFDRSGAASIRVDLEGGTATGFWDATIINYTLSNIEDIRGSNVGVDFLGGSSSGDTNGANAIDGRKGVDVINGRGGDDVLTGGDDRDVFIIDPFNDDDTIKDFTIGQDLIAITDSGLTSTAGFATFTFDGTDTLIELTSTTEKIKVEGVDLVNVANPNANFVFNKVVANAGTTTFDATNENSLLIGTADDDKLNGGDGNDIIMTRGAKAGYNNTGDRVDAGAGDDLIIGESGLSLVIGGAGNDRIQGYELHFINDLQNFSDSFIASYMTSTSGITVNYTGDVRVGLQAQQVNDGLGGIDTLGGVTGIADSAHNDTFFIDGSDPNRRSSQGGPRAFLSDGNDTVTFLGNGGQIDYFFAVDGVNASLTSGTASDRNLRSATDNIGNDTFTGANRLLGSQYDDILTGDGNDNRFRGRGGDDVIDGMGGTNQVNFFSTTRRVVVDLTDADGNTFEVDDDGEGGRDQLTNIQNIATSVGSDIITGDNANNRLDGNGGNDLLMGGAGEDILNGDFGSTGLDNVGIVRGGDDYLDGGLGNDFLRGGDDADVFAIKSLGGGDFIDDFDFAEGDRIDISTFSFANSAAFSTTYDAVNDKTDFFFGSEAISVRGDLTGLSQSDLDQRFIFNVIEGVPGATSETLTGTAGDDYFRPVASIESDQILASGGSDTIDYLFAIESFQILNYSSFGNGITFNVDSFDNTASVAKGGGDTDTIRNIFNPLNSGFFTAGGGFAIVGTAFADVFNVDTETQTWMSIVGGDGVDSYNIANQDSGAVRLDFREGANAVSINLGISSNQIINDGFGNTESITGPGSVREIRGTDFTDSFVGSTSNESFITRGGNDFVDGGGGFDRVRYDRSVFDAGINVDLTLTTGTVTGTFNNGGGSTAFSQNLTSIEWIRGTGFADTMSGTSGSDRLEGNGGADVLQGLGGDDELRVPDIAFQTVDGGLGIDSLRILDGGQVLDFTGLGTSRINSIEKLELGVDDNDANGAGTTVTLDDQNMIDFSETFDPFVTTLDTDPSGSTGTALAESNEVLLITGDNDDVINLGNSGTNPGASWQLAGNDQGFNVYNFTESATTYASVAVEDDVVVNIV